MQNKNKHLLILASVAVIFIIAALFSSPTNIHIEGSGDHVFPELLPRVNDVTYIKITRNDGTLTLTRDGDIWTVKENDNYPAAVEQVRQLVLGIANMKLVEPKTSKPENYGPLGLQDVEKDGAKSTHVVLTAGTDKKLADIIIGDSKPAKGNDNQKSYYIRKSGNPQSWLAEAALPDQWKPKNWLDIDVMEIKRDRIQQVKVNHQNGELVYIHRNSPDVRDFTLESLQPGERVTAPYEVNNIATTFTKMTFDDVVNAGNAKAEEQPIYTAVLKTFDGLEITFEPHKAGDKYLATVSATFDQAFANQWQEKLAQQSTETDTDDAAKPADAAHGGGDSGNPADNPAFKSPEEVQDEAKSYNDRWNNWMYQLPNFRVENIGKKKQDLLAKEGAAAPVH
ncbi:MAG: DUF4340 domain-containing protein [Gammaproteobacteria bacterium]|jgi:hypothetical protein